MCTRNPKIRAREARPETHLHLRPFLPRQKGFEHVCGNHFLESAPAKSGTSTRYSQEISGKQGQALVIPRKFPARSAGKNFSRVFQRKIQENHRNHWSGQKKKVRKPGNPVSGPLRRPNTPIIAGPFFLPEPFFCPGKKKGLI